MGKGGLLIAGGRLTDTQGVYEADVLIEGQKIKGIGIPGAFEHDGQVIDAEGMIVLPGLIDPHVHFEKDEFMGTRVVHDFDSGTAAALHGGVTTVIDFYNQKHGESLFSCLDKTIKEAEGKARCDWSSHVTITDPTEETLADMARLIDRGIPTFKCYTTYKDDGLMIGDYDLLRVLGACARFGGMILVHTEDDALSRWELEQFVHEGRLSHADYPQARHRTIENQSIQRVTQMAEHLGSAVYVVHMSTREGVDLIAHARERGARVFGETCTHYLVLDEGYLSGKDSFKYFCNPPLRTKKDQEALWNALSEGRLNVVSTDDSAFSLNAKRLGRDRFDRVPAGLHGVETRLPLLYSQGVKKGRISLQQLVAMTSTNVAKIFGLFPQKGQIAPGSDADIVIFDPEETWVMGVDTLHMVPRWSPYEGWQIEGKVHTVLSRGEVVVDRGKLSANAGRGRRVQRHLTSHE